MSTENVMCQSSTNLDRAIRKIVMSRCILYINLLVTEGLVIILMIDMIKNYSMFRSAMRLDAERAIYHRKLKIIMIIQEAH